MRTSAKKNPNADLLIAGGRDFLKASAAIARFGGSVYDCGVKVLRRRANDLKQSTGLKPDTDKILAFPKEGFVNSDHDGTYAVIGPYMLLAKSYFNLYVWWRTGDDAAEECSAVASVGCTHTEAGVLLEALRSIDRGRLQRDPNYRGEIYLEKPLKPEELPDLDKHFDTLVAEWIRLAKGIGGFRKLLK